MKLIRLLLPGSLALLAASSLSGCITEPSYPVVPEISLKEAKLTPLNDRRGARDSLTLTINYQDGDGDLGLTDVEAKAAPYVNTRFAQNFFLNPYVRSSSGGSTFIQLADANRGLYSVASYNQTFVHAIAAADSRSMPIKGTLTLGASFVRGYNFPLSGENVQFHVSIADRAMHESNVIIVPVTFP